MSSGPARKAHQQAGYIAAVYFLFSDAKKLLQNGGVHICSLGGTQPILYDNVKKPKWSHLAVDEDNRSNVSWWQTVPGILTGVGATIAALTGLVAALTQAGLFDWIIVPPPPQPPPPPSLEKFIGDYDYRSTPDDVNQGPFIDEQGNMCNQLIGELSIHKDVHQEYSVDAKRYYCVAIENDNPVLRKIDPVEWEAKSDNVFLPQIGQEIIFLLATKKDPPNRGLIKASISKETKEGKADIINGSMLYLIPRNFEKNRKSPHWLKAKVEFRRKDRFGDDIYYTKGYK